MRDRDRRASGLESLEGLSDLTLGRGIHVAGGLVEDQQPGARDLRARAPRAAAPPRRGSPRSPTRVSSPSGKVFNQSSRARCSNARSTSSSPAPGRPRAHAGVEEEPILRDHAHRRRRESAPRGAGRPRRAGCALRQDRRAGTAASRTSTRSPSRPRSRRGRPRGCRRRCRGARVPLSIRELEALDAHRQRALGQRDARDRLLDVDREVDHAEHLPPAGDGRLRLGEDLRQIEEGIQNRLTRRGTRRRAPR